MTSFQRSLVRQAKALAAKKDADITTLARGDDRDRGTGPSTLTTAGAAAAGYGGLAYLRGRRFLRSALMSPDIAPGARVGAAGVLDTLKIGHQQNLRNVSAFFRRPYAFPTKPPAIPEVGASIVKSRFVQKAESGIGNLISKLRRFSAADAQLRSKVVKLAKRTSA